MDIMLNLPNINNFLFIFLIKNRSYKHYIFKEGIHPPDRQEEMMIHAHFPCHKQPTDSVYCGYYMCEHMRGLYKYTTDPQRVRVYILLGIEA